MSQVMRVVALKGGTVGLQRRSLVLYNYGCQPAGHGIDLVNCQYLSCISFSQDHPAICVSQTLHALRKDIKLLTSLVPIRMFIPITLPLTWSFVAAFA